MCVRINCGELHMGPQFILAFREQVALVLCAEIQNLHSRAALKAMD